MVVGEDRPAFAVGIARVPGTCGELAQGLLDGVHFHITCPIDRYATAEVALVPGSGRAYGAADCPKASTAAAITLSRGGRHDVDAVLSVASRLPRGKGMASSTADVVAAATAVAVAAGLDISIDAVADIALEVEPTDGLMYPGIAFFDHRQGKARRLIGAAPAMYVLVLDFGGVLDTLAYNATDRTAQLRRLESRWKDAASLVETGIKTGSAELIGAGATISALAHQEILPKPQLDAVMRFARRAGAVGVNVAHSGTVLGVLFDGDRDRAENARLRALEALAGLEAVFLQRLVDGGTITENTHKEVGAA